MSTFSAKYSIQEMRRPAKFGRACALEEWVEGAEFEVLAIPVGISGDCKRGLLATLVPIIAGSRSRKIVTFKTSKNLITIIVILKKNYKYVGKSLLKFTLAISQIVK